MLMDVVQHTGHHRVKCRQTHGQEQTANVIAIVNSLSNQNRFITEQVSYVHKSGNGYELENAKREECYIKLKADMEKVAQSTIDLMRYVEVSK